jgi:hypothetical protein
MHENWQHWVECVCVCHKSQTQMDMFEKTEENRSTKMGSFLSKIAFHAINLSGKMSPLLTKQSKNF